VRYYIIAGEASGDLHGSNLVKAVYVKDAQADIRAWGGDKMEAAGATLVKHYRDLAFMGFVEVVEHLPTILRNLRFCKEDIQRFKPDVLVLIDYPGFNLRIAEWAKARGIKVCYYISPQVWAWKEGRVKKIREIVDRMLVILPFELPFYQRWNYGVTYVGHPLIEVVEEELAKPLPAPLSSMPIVALLPGSRAQEIQQKLPVMLAALVHFPDYQAVIAGAPAQPDELYESLMKDTGAVLVRNQTYEVLRQSRAALVTSGTATLETALFGVPQVVCYRGNPLSYLLAKRFIKVKYISLVNLILDRPAVPELIQHGLAEDALVAELRGSVGGQPHRRQMLKDYGELRAALGTGGASAAAAEAVIELARS
jgi:lipid-A-disaccharide synthase